MSCATTRHVKLRYPWLGMFRSVSLLGQKTPKFLHMVSTALLLHSMSVSAKGYAVFEAAVSNEVDEISHAQISSKSWRFLVGSQLHLRQWNPRIFLPACEVGVLLALTFLILQCFRLMANRGEDHERRLTPDAVFLCGGRSSSRGRGGMNGEVFPLLHLQETGTQDQDTNDGNESDEDSVEESLLQGEGTNAPGAQYALLERGDGTTPKASRIDTWIIALSFVWLSMVVVFTLTIAIMASSERDVASAITNRTRNR